MCLAIGGKCLGGKCPGGICPEVSVRGVHVQFFFVLSPYRSNAGMKASI